MVKEYIATFHSHFGAVRFHREMLKEGKSAILQPVPRDLSSSCGTAVRFFQDDKGKTNSFSISDPHGEIEQVVEILDIGYKICYSELD